MSVKTQAQMIPYSGRRYRSSAGHAKHVCTASSTPHCTSRRQDSVGKHRSAKQMKAWCGLLSLAHIPSCTASRAVHAAGLIADEPEHMRSDSEDCDDAEGKKKLDSGGSPNAVVAENVQASFLFDRLHYLTYATFHYSSKTTPYKREDTVIWNVLMTFIIIIISIKVHTYIA